MFPENANPNRELLYKFHIQNDNRRTGVVHKVVVALIVVIIGSVIMLAGLWQFTHERIYHAQLVIHTDHLIQETDVRFLSIALDTSSIQNGWVHENIKSVKLLKLAGVLTPAYLRVGGTLADRLVFQPDSTYAPVTEHKRNISDGGECSYEMKKCALQNLTFFNMSSEDWVALNEFAQDAGLQLLFDLNVLLRNGSRWDSSNARQLLEMSDKLHFNVCWQLGNEPNSFRHVFGEPLSGATLGRDFTALRQLLNSYPSYRASLLVGPDVTHPTVHSSSLVGDPPIPYLKKFLVHASGAMSAISWHQYYLNGRKAKLKDFVNPTVLNSLACEISAIWNATDGFSLPVWLTETGSAYGGGARGMSDRYVGGFLWLDKLGLAAQLGMSVVVRQSLYGGYYGLLDSALNPLPDWWVSVLYKKLVGPGVLGTSMDDVIDVTCPGSRGHLRLYCQCARQLGAVTVFGLNLLKQETEITVTGLPTSSNVLAYVLTADVILKSRHILLNGKRLHLHPDGSLPPFEPVEVDLRKPLAMPPFSMAFWVIQDVNVLACPQ